MVRRSRRFSFNDFVERGERRLIRVLILASVLLVLAQLSLAKDPVQFYLAVAQKVESPSLELADTALGSANAAAGSAASVNQNAGEAAGTWVLVLKTSPAAAVRVWQDGKVIAVLGEGEKQLKVRTGVIQLDAREINGVVKVQVSKLDSRLHEPRLNQTFVLNKDVQSMFVSP
ncbi:hypothetical protein [Paradesulfitobacterium ferrireducens]|uniref:hypothetical protein n=1 Tax=Paradesulfitobacterium ferrireducens TaxID=2816476 RepID=UPI001A8E38A8|nr:hypothetical protein [Paradesulfitobacterium ferrireducens]